MKRNNPDSRLKHDYEPEAGGVEGTEISPRNGVFRRKGGTEKICFDMLLNECCF